MSKKPRVSKADWLTQALELLEAEGISGVRIERLARELGVAKSGFYWHFADRDDLLSAMLAFWKEEFTESVATSPRVQVGDAENRLREAMEMIEEHQLARYDLAFRGWAEHDDQAMRAVRQVNRRRFSYITGLFEALGFRDDDLVMRVQLFVCYHSWQQTLHLKQTKAKRAELRELRLQMMIAK